MSDRCHMHEQVVRHQGNGQVHRHEYCNRFARLPLVEDVEVGEPQEQCDRDGKPEEEPPRFRRHPGHDRPRHRGNDHSNDSELPVVGELEVPVTFGARKHPFTDDYQGRVCQQRSNDRCQSGQHHARWTRLTVLGREVEVGASCESVEHA